MQASIGKEPSSSKVSPIASISDSVSDSGLCKYGGGEDGGRVDSDPSGFSENDSKILVGVAEPDSTASGVANDNSDSI